MATPTFFDWNRLWYPLGAQLPVAGGYLSPNPTDDGAPLADLSNVPCLVLLGAPGMGKSYEGRKLESELRGKGEAVDLIEAQRRRDLGQTLLDLVKSEHAKAWIESAQPWTVLVDGLDELEGGASTFSDSLQRFLDALADGGGDLKLFRLRLLCRTVEWAASLEELLAARWGSSELQKRQLAPLTEDDVLQASDKYLGDTDEARDFIAAVGQSHVEALAAKPVSWRMLVRLFEQAKALPARQAELFEQGLQTLLQDPGRPARPGRRTTDLETLLIMAGRIATAMALSGTGAVALGDGRSVEVEGGAITLASLVDGSEPIPPYSVTVRYDDLVEVVRSQLFIAIGTDVYVWAHQTFMEFLAARYLVRHELPPDQLLEFLTVQDPGGATSGVPPQLREIAAWAATLSPEVFQSLLTREPDVLLQSDVAAAEPNAREHLVGALIDRLATNELADRFWRLRPLLSRLAYPGLSDKLRAVIIDPKDSLAARRGAIDIAEECQLHELAPLFVDLASDGAAPLALRREAAGGVTLLGAADDKRRLAQQLLASGTELDDELRGAVLQATWPQSLSVPQLLSAFTAPQDPSFIGLYASFLYGFDPGQVSSADALTVLDWIEPHLDDGGERTSFSFRRAVSRLFWSAVAAAGDPEVRRALARLINVAFDRLAHTILQGDDDVAVRWPAPPEDRVALVIAILKDATDAVRTGRYLHHFAPSLLSIDDLDLFLASYTRADLGEVRPALAELIVSLSRQKSLDELGDLYTLQEKDADLRRAWLAAYFIANDAPEVEWLRKSWTAKADQEKRLAEQAVHRERADQAILDLLARIEQGEPSVWWQLNLQLFVSDKGQYEGTLEFQSDLTETPGWKRLKPEQQQRVLGAAELSLTRYRLETLEWLSASTHSRPAAAGYRALRLLHDVRPDRYGALPTAVWRNWGPAAVWFFDNDATAASDVQTEIVRDAYLKAPRSVLRALSIMARRSQEGLSQRSLEVLSQAYDEHLGQALSTLRGKRLAGETSDGAIVDLLVQRQFPPLIEQLKAELAALADGDLSDLSPGFSKAIGALLHAGYPDVWRSVQRLSTTAPEAAKAIWQGLAHNYSFRNDPKFDSLDERILADTYVALYALFPERPELSGGRFLDAVDLVERLRSSILNFLVSRGTSAAVEALSEAAPRANDGGWAQRVLPDARENFRSKAAGRDATKTLKQIGLSGPSYQERPAQQPTPPAAPPEIFAEPPTHPTTAVGLIAEPAPSGEPASAQAKLAILSVATEWSSSKGGVSTLNRELCLALADQGHTVCCVVIDATDTEITQARATGVTIVRAPKMIGIEDRERLLLLTREHFDGQKPDFVFGHDQVTGPYALRLSQAVGGAYVHFLHTVPEEIEPHKGRTTSVHRGNDKREAQAALCEASRLIVGVGPRIAGGAPPVLGVEVHEFIPGLNLDLSNRPVNKPRRPVCLIAGRMEDADLKGLRIASAVIWSLGEKAGSGIRPQLVVRGIDEDAQTDDIAAATGLALAQLQNCILPRKFTTDLKELHRDLDGASVVLMPSLAEGFGLTGFEAVAAGRPVLISKQSGLAEWLIRLEDDDVIEQGFVEACIAEVAMADLAAREALWADKLSKLLADPEAAYLRASRVRDKLKDTFTWDRAAAGLADELRVISQADALDLGKPTS